MTEYLFFGGMVVNGGMFVLILGQLFSINRRLGSGDSALQRIEKECPIWTRVCPMLKGKGDRADGL